MQDSNSLTISGIDQQRPISAVPTASSVYSEHSPEMASTPPNHESHPRSSSIYPDDVSPPDSPQPNQMNNNMSKRESPDISPVSDNTGSSVGRSPVFGSGRLNSGIPIPKKTRKFWNRPSLESQDKGSKLTHWDVYSGEPTTSERGKPPSTTPQAVKLHEDPTPPRTYSNGDFGTSTHISGGVTPIGRKRVASRDSNNSAIVRPEWRGAGGRHKIINPLMDKPLPPGKSPSFPVGKEILEQEQREIDENEATFRARAQSLSPTPEHSIQNGASQHLQPAIRLDDGELDQDYGMPISNSDASLRTLTPPSYPPRKGSQDSQLTPEDRRSPLARNPSNEEMKEEKPHTVKSEPHDSSAESYERAHEYTPERRGSKELPEIPPRYDSQNNDIQALMAKRSNTLAGRPLSDLNEVTEDEDSNQVEDQFRTNLQQMNLQDEPKSRFSTTTYATTIHDSPPSTPDMSSYPPSLPSMSNTPNSILNRKRPVPPAGLPSSRVAARKPTPMESGPLPPTPTSETRRKSLPKSPPEKSAISRVAVLQAKVDNLRRRRINLQTVIHELTHVIQPSSIAYDIASRQEIKRTVEGLNKELADVIKDEHETGIKLHRAIKRDDEFGAYEPTSIWVRRVTS